MSFNNIARTAADNKSNKRKCCSKSFDLSGKRQQLRCSLIIGFRPALIWHSKTQYELQQFSIKSTSEIRIAKLPESQDSKLLFQFKSYRLGNVLNVNSGYSHYKIINAEWSIPEWVSALFFVLLLLFFCLLTCFPELLFF